MQVKNSIRLAGCAGLVGILLVTLSRIDAPSELATVFDDPRQYRFPRDTEVVDDPPMGWAYTAHIQRNSDGDIEHIDVPNNAVVKRVKDGWSIELPKPEPRDLYDSESYLPRGDHLYRKQFTAKEWAAKKLLEKFFRADSGEDVDFESHGMHSDIIDDWNRNYDTHPRTKSREVVSPIFGGVRDCEDIDCYLNRVNGGSDDDVMQSEDAVPETSEKVVKPTEQQPKGKEDNAEEGCGVSCLISFLSNAVASQRPRPAKELDPVTDVSSDEDSSLQSPDPDLAGSIGTNVAAGDAGAGTSFVQAKKIREESRTADMNRKGTSTSNDDIQIRRSADGKIAEILIPPDATISTTPSGLRIRARKMSRGRPSLQEHRSSHDESDFPRRAIVDAYAPNQDPYYCMHGNLAVECGSGPRNRYPRHDYSLGWQTGDGSLAPLPSADAQSAGKLVVVTPKQAKEKSVNSGSLSSRGLRRVVRDFVQALRDSIESDASEKKGPVEAKAPQKAGRVHDSKLRSEQVELERHLKEYEDQIKDLKSVLGDRAGSHDNDEVEDSVGQAQETTSAPAVESRSTRRLVAENALLSSRLQAAKARVARMQYMLSLGQTQDRATQPLPLPRAESLAMLPADRTAATDRSAESARTRFLKSWIHAAEANNMARLREAGGGRAGDGFDSAGRYQTLKSRVPTSDAEPAADTRPAAGNSVQERASELAVDAAAAAALARQASGAATQVSAICFSSLRPLQADPPA
jgi:hypothetical protein